MEDYIKVAAHNEINALQRILIKNESKELNIANAAEEMLELSQMLIKDFKKSSKYSRELLVKEFSHALLMLDIIKDIYNISEDEIIPEELEYLTRNTDKYSTINIE